MKTIKSELIQKEQDFLSNLEELRQLEQYKKSNFRSVQRWQRDKAKRIINELKNLAWELKRKGSHINELDRFTL